MDDPSDGGFNKCPADLTIGSSESASPPLTLETHVVAAEGSTVEATPEANTEVEAAAADDGSSLRDIGAQTDESTLL